MKYSHRPEGGLNGHKRRMSVNNGRNEVPELGTLLQNNEADGAGVGCNLGSDGGKSYEGSC